MTNSGKNVSGQPPKKRIVSILLLGLLLFGAGYGVYQSGALGVLYGMFGGDVADKATKVPYSREQLKADRERYKKDPTQPAPRVPMDANGYFIPPDPEDIPDDKLGEGVRRGREIFNNTSEAAKEYVGSALACVNCHLDSGRREHSAPMWGAFGSYPAYRSKTRSINTLKDRMYDCFTYSMNAQDSPSGAAPPMNSDIYRDVISYIGWMADGSPSGGKLHGSLYPKLKETELGYDYTRGEAVYVDNCQLCHAEQGQGRMEQDGSKVRFPPLWGAHSYNWGAGMARVDTAVGFIKANMPLGKPFSLEDQDAWDVAAYINSHERPKDPRQTGTVEETADYDHKNEKSYYGKMVNGELRGVGVTKK